MKKNGMSSYHTCKWGKFHTVFTPFHTKGMKWCKFHTVFTPFHTTISYHMVWIFRMFFPDVVVEYLQSPQSRHEEASILYLPAMHATQAVSPTPTESSWVRQWLKHVVGRSAHTTGSSRPLKMSLHTSGALANTCVCTRIRSSSTQQVY